MTDHNSESKRAAKRDSLFLMADLNDESGRPIGSARVRNLSATGLMAETDGHFAEGQKVHFTLRGVGAVIATVSWMRAGRIGLLFEEEIDPQAARRPVAVTKQPAPSVYTRFPRTLR